MEASLGAVPPSSSAVVRSGLFFVVKPSVANVVPVRPLWNAKGLRNRFDVLPVVLVLLARV